MKRALGMAFVAIALLAPAAQTADKAKTDVTLDFAGNPMKRGSAVYEGSVGSPEKSCAKNRQVEIFIDGPGANDDRVAKGKAKTRSKIGDRWIYDAKQNSAPLAGTYYAKAEATDDCKKGKSDPYEWTRRAAPRAEQAKTKVTFEGDSSNAGVTTYTGKVKSPEKKCMKDRKITAYLRQPGDDEKLGSDKAQPSKVPGTYFWEISVMGGPIYGTFYAVAKETDDCKEDTSEKITVKPLKAKRGSAARAGKSETRVAFIDIVPVDGDYWYEGTIDAKKKCAMDRKVTVYRKQSGKDEKIGTDKSNGSTGSWTVMDPDQADGTYYAKTPSTSECKGDKSDKLSVQP